MGLSSRSHCIELLVAMPLVEESGLDHRTRGAIPGVRPSCDQQLKRIDYQNDPNEPWEFDTSAPVAETISQRANGRFVNRDTTGDWVGIVGGAGGSPSYHSDAIFYLGFPTS